MKRIALFLAFVLFLLSIAACGGGGPATTEAATTAAATTAAATTAAATTAATTAAASADIDMLNAPWETAYPETITITTANRENSSFIFPDGGDYDDNIWFTFFLDRLNIQVVNDWISAEYVTSLNLAIAAQNLPDVYYVNNAQFKQVVDAGLVMDITEVHGKLESETLRSFNNADPSVIDAARVNGRLYGQPRTGWGNNVDRPCFMWFRNDWMEEMGYSGLNSIDEIADIVRQMNDDYGTKGMAFDKTVDWILQIAPSWHAYPLIWVDVNGAIEYGGIQPAMKTALEQWAKWYKEGLINPEFAAKDYEATVQDLVSGVCGAAPMWQWAGWAFGANSVRNNGPEAWFRPYLVPTIDGKQQMTPLKFDNGDEVIVVNKDCKYPEAVIKLINMYVYVNNDAYPTDITTLDLFEKYTENDMQHYPSFRVNNPLGEYHQYLEAQWALANNRDTSQFTIPVALIKYNFTTQWIDDANPEGLGAAMQLGMPFSAYAQTEPFFQNDWFIRSKMWGPSPEPLLRFGTTLQDLLIEGYTKIIMGVEPIDYFDKLVDEWKAAGGVEATAAVNAEFK